MALASRGPSKPKGFAAPTLGPESEDSGIPKARDLCEGCVDHDASTETRGRWTRADVDRLVAGDNEAWDRLLGVVASMVETQAKSWRMTTLEVDAVRDHVEEILLACGMRRLKAVRDPGKLAPYLAAITRNRARYVAKHRSKVVVHRLSDLQEDAFGRPADVRPSAAFSQLADTPAADFVGLVRALLRFRDAPTDRQFRVLWLRHIEGLPTRRVAECLKVARQTIAELHDAAISAIKRARCARSTAP